MEKFCSNCGSELKEGSNVCLKCGKLRQKQTVKKDVDKNTMTAIIVGSVAIGVCIFFFLIAIFVSIIEEEEYDNENKKYCCIQAGGKWSDDRCRTGYWFDEDEYDYCLDYHF